MIIETYQVILLLSLIVIALFRMPSKLVGFNYFILYCVFVEWFVLKYTASVLGNNILYANLFVKTTIVYYLYLFITNNPNYNASFAWKVISAYIVFSFANFFFIEGMWNLNTYCFNAGMLAVIFYIFKYMYDAILKQTYFNLASHPIFWIGIGILFFYITLFPLFTFFNILLDKEPTLLNQLYVLVPIANIFLYTGYLITLLCPVLIRN